MNYLKKKYKTKHSFDSEFHQFHLNFILQKTHNALCLTRSLYYYSNHIKSIIKMGTSCMSSKKAPAHHPQDFTTPPDDTVYYS